MTGEQERKAVNYALFFLRSEIKDLKNSIEESRNPHIKPQLERRLEELEKDFDMFLNVEGMFYIQEVVSRDRHVMSNKK